MNTPEDLHVADSLANDRPTAAPGWAATVREMSTLAQ
jgi:hypothetical protein